MPRNDYGLIPSHNPFRLRAIVPDKPVPPPEPPALAPRRILLTGIFALSGTKALLQIEDQQTRKTEFPPPLAVGESYDTITIVAIDAENHTVSIRNGKADATLDFINHGVQPKPGALVAPVPPSGGMRANPYPVPRALGTGETHPNSPPPLKGGVVLGGGESSVAPPVGTDPNSATRTGGVMTREEVDERIRIEREIRMRNNDPTYKLLPPVRTDPLR